MDLQDFRKQIDEIDHELMALFQRRMETVEKIAAYKAQRGLPVRDPGGRKRSGKRSWGSSPQSYRTVPELCSAACSP